MKFARKAFLMTALAAVSIPVSPALAHRQWLLPSATNVEGEAPYVTFDAAVSEGLFDFDHLPIKLDGLSVTGPDGQPVTVENAATGKRRSTFDIKLAKPGTYRATQVSASVMVSYLLNGEQKRWRGAEADLATSLPAGATDVKTSRMESRLDAFVAAGNAGDALPVPVGKGLELLPLSSPTSYELGAPARFRALLDGQPVAGLDVTVVPGGGRFRADVKDMTVKTDAAGEVSITWPMAGMMWVGASWPARQEAPAAPPAGAAPAPAAAETPPAPRPMAPRRVSYAATLEVAPF